MANNKMLTLGVLIYSAISLTVIFYDHHYYHDEIYNIDLLSLSFYDILAFMQSRDTHPPLSNFFNKIIYDTFLSLKAILVFAIVLNISALAYFYHFAESKLADVYSKILLFIFVFLNGGLLLWTNSLRWYSYWVPLFVILYTLILRSPKLSTKQLVVIAMLLSCMTYINYLTFLLIIALFVMFLVSRRQDISVKNIFLVGGLYALLSAYQIYIFITVHMLNRSAQIQGFSKSLFGAIYGIMNGGSVFIANPILVLFSVLTLWVMVSGLKKIRLNLTTVDTIYAQSVLLLVTLFVLMVITGVGGVYRSSIGLSIPFYFLMAYFLMSIKNINFKRLYLSVAFLLTCTSVFNLVARENTAKNSFNMPTSRLNQLLDNPHNKIAVTYDRVTNFYLTSQKYDVQYYVFGRPVKKIVPKGTEVYLVRTYQGVLGNRIYNQVLQSYARIEKCLENVRKVELGKDKYHKIKNRLRGKKPRVSQALMFVTYGTVKSTCTL